MGCVSAAGAVIRVMRARLFWDVTSGKGQPLGRVVFSRGGVPSHYLYACFPPVCCFARCQQGAFASERSDEATHTRKGKRWKSAVWLFCVFFFSHVCKGQGLVLDAPMIISKGAEGRAENGIKYFLAAERRRNFNIEHLIFRFKREIRES